MIETLLATFIALGSISAYAAPILKVTTALESDEVVSVLPTYAWQSADGKFWQTLFTAIFYEPERKEVSRKAAIAGIAAMLGLKGSEPQQKLFQERALPFLRDHERQKSFQVAFGNIKAMSPPSSGNGVSKVSLQLPLAAVNASIPKGETWLPMQVEPGKGSNESVFSSVVNLIPPEGITVVSDIDDTIKLSNVLDKRELLKNTFLQPFKDVPGMASRYQKLQKEGAVFHYVSASPWQLIAPLSEFLEQKQFPKGTFHLKPLRPSRLDVAMLLDSQTEYKLNVIKEILTYFPQRKFYLIGDSGEQDPQVYAELYRLYPNQVKQIWIRDIGNPTNVNSMQSVMKDIPKSIWKLFQDPANL